MPNRLAIAALALVLGIVAVAAVVASNAAPVLAGSCAPLEGGGNGGTSQVRFLDARDDHVTFTFGQSAIGSFEVPRYRLEQSGSASDRRTFALRFGAASTTNPDGSPSLEALPLLQPEDRVLRQ